MYRSVVDYLFKNIFLTFTFYRRLPNVAERGVTYPLLSLSTDLGALITRWLMR